MVVRIACAGEVRERLSKEAAERAAETTRVRPRVEVVDAAAIYDPGKQAKAKRFVDERATRT